MFCGTCTLQYRHHALMCQMEHFGLRKGVQPAAHAYET
jgi:hypothetical protein